MDNVRNSLWPTFDAKMALNLKIAGKVNQIIILDHLPLILREGIMS